MSDKEETIVADDVESGVEIRETNEILGAFAKKEKEKEKEDEDLDEDLEDEDLEDEDETEEDETEEETEDEDETEEEGGDEEEEDGEDEEESDELDAKDEEGKPINSKELLSSKVKLKTGEEIEEISIRDLVKKAQLEKTATQRFQVAAGKTKKAIAIVESFIENPMDSYIKVHGRQIGLDAAYDKWLEVCKESLKEEMEIAALDPEKRAEKRAELKLKRKDEEIARLKADSEARDINHRNDRMIRQLYNEVKAAGLPDEDDVYAEVAAMWDNCQARGIQASISDCVKAYQKVLQKRKDSLIKGMSDEDLKKYGFSRANGGEESMTPGRSMRVKKKRQTSTPKAKKKRKPRKRDPSNPNNYKSSFAESLLE